MEVWRVSFFGPAVFHMSLQVFALGSLGMEFPPFSIPHICKLFMSTDDYWPSDFFGESGVAFLQGLVESMRIKN